MKKYLEATDPNSCWNKANHTELTFILLERDIAAPSTVRFWCYKRIQLEKNGFDDPQIQDALAWAESIDGRHIEDPDGLDMYVEVHTEG